MRLHSNPKDLTKCIFSRRSTSTVNPETVRERGLGVTARQLPDLPAHRVVRIKSGVFDRDGGEKPAIGGFVQHLHTTPGFLQKISWKTCGLCQTGTRWYLSWGITRGRCKEAKEGCTARIEEALCCEAAERSE